MQNTPESANRVKAIRSSGTKLVPSKTETVLPSGIGTGVLGVKGESAATPSARHKTAAQTSVIKREGRIKGLTPEITGREQPPAMPKL